ncbi:MAG: hypothetical protein COW18_11420 [Zetaproteobacteria bacterium CG12_big_fil_rev_8_21_14_0_65_54_13]|nr:MAG: hypothetical protein COX55_03870 [Zetaproteobacteria bacterium CG23_combo_of_CG06-09_8_20_14_all_54_7]PIW45517.1 MAG: hypothetical protein COW18_11420 [Zetaproteobacteria bacterium CG12_big_fil_rev_8_21_14_0_65_54_13]PIX54052.1 MAG: hypothetical protein COZ50_09980 [Zetaproteobacteria bacterium CG_4_10_14_3_um_filter_54_28]PJA28912.1 MAG: hypothetical protein CO188_07970 [Zetaproteobacteria bacterium CG_4_9_14_3_um_filter_54_145]
MVPGMNEVVAMRFLMMMVVSLFMLTSCSVVRTAMVTTMDVITAPYHWVTDEDHYDEHDDTIN